MRARNLWLALVLFALGTTRAWAAGEINGRLEGTVTEAQTGSPVPGATITVSGKALIGGAKTLTTGEDGRYEVVELPPGTYDLEVSYSGVKPIHRRVVVQQGMATPVDIAWSAELAEAETTVVVEERHLTKPDSTQSGAVISAESEGKVAINHRYQQMVNQTAGVVQPDAASLQFAVKGASILANRWLVDGMDVTDPVSGTWSANINFDSVASEEILTGGMEAQYNSMGGVVNLITAAGSDDWHIDSSFYVNNAAFSAPSTAGSQFYNGYRPFDNRPTPPTSGYQANLNVGGPILKHRLWFNISGEYFYEQFSVPAGPPLNIQHPSFYRHQFLGRLKLTWAPSDKHRITLAANMDPAWLYNIDGRFAGASNYERGVAETQQNQGGFFTTLQWEYFLNQNINTMVQGGFQYSTIDYGAQGVLGGPGKIDFGPGCPNPNDPSCTYDPNRARHTNANDNTVWYQGDSLQLDKRYTVVLDPTVSLRGRAAGYHDAKIGIQSRYVYHTNEYHTPGGYQYTDGGDPSNVSMNTNGTAGLCDEMAGMAGHSDVNCYQRKGTPDATLHDTGVAVGLFIQDRWKPLKWLTIVPGIRFDYGWTQNNTGQTVSSLFGIGPRLGAVVDLTRDQKTIFSAYYGRANDVMSLMAASAMDTPVTTTQQWNPMTKNWDLLATSGGPSGYLLDKNLKTPHTDEFSTSLRREIFLNSVAMIEYTYKQISNIWDGVEVNQIWDPTGTKVRGFANGMPQTIYMLSTPDANYRTYQGVDFSIEAKPTPNWEIWAAYTLSWTYGPGNEQLGQINGSEPGNSAFYNPRQRIFYDGFLPDDHRHNLKLRLAYSWKGLTVGGLFSYISGAPLSKGYFNGFDGGYTNHRAPQGLDPGSPNNTGAWTELRLPDLVSVDARVSYDFHSLIKQHLIVIADLFNLFNLQNGTGIDNTDTATYGTVQGRQKPFRFQVGLRYLY
jgi:hypothetical protein